MDPEQKFYSIFHDFSPDLSTEILEQSPEIQAYYIGGSFIYLDQADIVEGTHPLYWNAAIIVNTNLDIFKLVNETRERLLKLTGIVQQECPEELFQVPSPDSEYWSEFDAVRFAGYDESGFMRSVVIMSLEYFFSNSPRTRSRSALNIYSYEDKRVYRSNRPGRVECQVLQASSLPNGFVILHDQWLYEDSMKPYDYRRDPSDLGFGQATDLLLGGIPLFPSTYGEQITKYVLSVHDRATGEHATAKSLLNSAFFSSDYAAWVNEKLNSYTITEPPLPILDSNIVLGSARQTALLSDTWTSEKLWDHDPSRSAETVPMKFVERYEHDIATSAKQHSPPIEYGVSREWEVTTVEDSGKSFSMLCKETPFAAWEFEKAVRASAYYPWVRVPRISDSDLLYFPIVEHELESEIRLRYIEGGSSNWDDAETLLHVEMVKAELMLDAYKRSLRDPALQRKHSDELLRSLLEKVAAKETTLRELYGDEIQLQPGVSVAIEEFLDMQWIINNERYPSLRQMLDRAHEDLHEAQSGPIVFGLGDASAPHTMVSPKTAQGGRKIIFDSYELSGYRPLMLDVARTFYFDVFFETVHLSNLTSREWPRVTYEVTKTTIEVTYATNYDWLARAIAHIKMRYLINPLEQEVGNAGFSFDGLITQLSSNILLLPALYQDFSGRPEDMITCLVNGIVMSRCRSWKDIYLGLQKLGFDILSI